MFIFFRNLVIGLVLAALILPVPALAQQTSTSSGPQTGLSYIKDLFGSDSDSLAGSTTARQVIIRVINILLGLLLSITVLFIILGGYQYVTSAGNEERAKKGRRTLLYAVIGLAIIMLAYTLTTLVGSALTSRQTI